MTSSLIFLATTDKSKIPITKMVIKNTEQEHCILFQIRKFTKGILKCQWIQIKKAITHKLQIQNIFLTDPNYVVLFD